MQHAEAVRLPESGDPAGVQITPEKIKAYLETLSSRGRSRETVQMYGAKLRTFYSYLPQDKQVGPDTLAAWRSASATIRSYSARALALDSSTIRMDSASEVFSFSS